MSERAAVVVGIDVAQAALEVAVRPDRAERQLPTDAPGMAELVAWRQGIHPQVLVLAATSGYEAPVAAEVCLAGLPVAVVKAHQGRDVATASGHVAKTDRLDAPVLAHCAAAVRRTAPHCAPRHDRCPMRKRRNWRRWWSGGASWWRCPQLSRRGWK